MILINIYRRKSTKTLYRQAKLPKMLSFLQPATAKTNANILAAEATLSFHTVKHHFSFRSSDCTNSLLKTIFEDSSIAKSIACGHTKSRAIAKNVFAKYFMELILADMSKTPFISVVTDASNHGASKLFPLLIQYFDYSKSIQTKLINLEALPSETSDEIFGYIKNSLEKLGLLEKVIGFAGDNCNTNFGRLARQGVQNAYSKLKACTEKQLIGIGCPVHTVHNAA